MSGQGQRHGQGRMTYDEGDSFCGEWSQDRPHGHGVFTHANSDTYTGEWVRGFKNGFGVFCYSEGDYRYEGTWAGGGAGGGRSTFQGQGTMLQHGKVLAVGIWPAGPWTEGGWNTAYPREGAEGTKVTARKSTGGPAPRKQLAS